MPTAADTRRPQTERRTFGRRDVDLQAIARLRDGSALSCRVRNISAMGALLEFEQEAQLPLRFRIVIACETFSAECERRHQTGRRVGVLFTSGRAEALARFG